MAHCLIVAPIVASGAPVLRDVLSGSLDAVLGRPNALGLPSRRRVVVLVVDAFHAMVSDRSYREGMSEESARIELKEDPKDPKRVTRAWHILTDQANRNDDPRYSPPRLRRPPTSR